MHYTRTEVPEYTCYVCGRILTDADIQFTAISHNMLRHFCSKSCLNMWNDAVTATEGDEY